MWLHSQTPGFGGWNFLKAQVGLEFGFGKEAFGLTRLKFELFKRVQMAKKFGFGRTIRYLS